MVVNNNDAGAGSLRQAIIDAVAAGPGPQSITFDPSLSGQTITLASNLPSINAPDITINGDINGDNVPDITIDGNQPGNITRIIFQLTALSDNAVIKGFHVKNTGSEAVLSNGSPTGVVIEDIIMSNDFGNFANYGIVWGNGANDLTIRNFTITEHSGLTSLAGIRIIGASSNILIDGYNYSNSGGGFGRGIDFDSPVSDLTITNTNIDLDNAGTINDGSFGIVFSSTTTTVDINNSNFLNAEVDGIRFTGVATDISMTDATTNNAEGSAVQVGVRFGAAVNRLVMTDVSIDSELTDSGTTNDGDFGLVFTGAINSVLPNTAVLTRVSVANADDMNIRVATSATNLTLEDCTISGLGEATGNHDGMNFLNSGIRSNVVINNSTFDTNGRAAIVLNSPSASDIITISNNTIINASNTTQGFGLWLISNGVRDISITGNTIADNRSYGIYNAGPDGVLYSQNSIFNNGDPGIFNTTGNFSLSDPVITSSVDAGGGNATITYTLPVGCTDCDVEFFRNNGGDEEENGRDYAGISLGVSGAGPHTADMPTDGNLSGFWTATYTDNSQSGSTSEFSLGSTPIGTSSPGGIPGNLALWLKADAGTGAGPDVATWADQSGNGVDGTAIVGEQPDLVANSMNYNPGLLFDEDQFDLPVTFDLVDNFEYIAVFQPNTTQIKGLIDTGGPLGEFRNDTNTFQIQGSSKYSCR